MATYAEMTEKATEQLLDAVKPVEDLVRSFAATTLEGVGKLPSLPRPEGVPTPFEIITANFLLAERLLGAQKDFALHLVSSVPTAATPAKAGAKG